MMQSKYQVKCYHFSIVEIIAERVSLILMSNIIKKLFYSVVQTSSGMLSFLHRQDHCWKCEFNTDFEIEKYIIVMESNYWIVLLIITHTIRKEECFCNLCIAMNSNLLDENRTKSVFTCNRDEISSRDETRPEMKKFLFTLEFHPRMKRVEFHPGMKFNLKENLPLSMMKTYKIFHFSRLLTSEAWYVKNIRRLKARCIKWLRLNAWGLQHY